ncbi:MAG TPA: hypothetical protein VIB48_25620 [Acidimicrobiia bacterium]
MLRLALRSSDSTCSPVMFELAARPHPPRELYRAYLAQSHVFVGIHGQSPAAGLRAPGARTAMTGTRCTRLNETTSQRLIKSRVPRARSAGSRRSIVPSTASSRWSALSLPFHVRESLYHDEREPAGGVGPELDVRRANQLDRIAVPQIHLHDVELNSSARLVQPFADPIETHRQFREPEPAR